MDKFRHVNDRPAVCATHTAAAAAAAAATGLGGVVDEAARVGPIEL